MADVGQLLINHQRNNVGLRSVNTTFKLPATSASATKYTMPLDTFSTTLSQQTATNKALKEARSSYAGNNKIRNNRRQNRQNAGTSQSNTNQQATSTDSDCLGKGGKYKANKTKEIS